ncbi:MAG: ATP synthase F1 subunit gamma [Campylobacterota bacterium]|nr:ATP synthase F1 subunit gamma [Campylobacterota bacterium]
MANLKDISRQIKSVKNTQKTTKAMKLVSSAKLRRTQQLSEQAKSYALKINDILSEIATRVSNVQDKENINRAFVPNDNPKTVDIVFVTADKGLCGGFNMTTIKTVRELVEEYSSKGTTVRLRAAGRKGIDYFNFQGVELLDSEIGLTSAPTYEKASYFVGSAFDDFNNGITDKVIMVYNGFLNMLSQELRVKDLLPVALDSVSVEHNSSMLDIEPDDDEEILNELTSKYVDFNMYYSLIDSLAAEHSARMQAMDNATNNAKEKVNDLTVQFNKARQAAITTELIEIISGVESMK